MSSIITATDSAILLALLACCWLGTLVVGGIVAIYIKSVIDSRSSSRPSSPHRRDRHHYKRRHNDDEEYLGGGNVVEGLRQRRVNKSLSHLSQSEQSIPNLKNSESSDSTAEVIRRPLHRRGTYFRLGVVRLFGCSRELLGCRVGSSSYIFHKSDDRSSRSRKAGVTPRGPSPLGRRSTCSAVSPSQKKYEDRCRSLLEELEREKAELVELRNQPDNTDQEIDNSKD